DYKALDFKLDRSGGELETDDDVDYGDEDDYGSDDIGVETEGQTQASDSVKTVIDSVSMDSISVDGILDSIPIDSTAINRMEVDSIETAVAKKVEEKLKIKKPSEIMKENQVDAMKETAIKITTRHDIRRSMQRSL